MVNGGISGAERDGWLRLAQAALEFADKPNALNARELRAAVKPAWRFQIPRPVTIERQNHFFCLCRQGQADAPDRDALGASAEYVIEFLGEPAIERPPAEAPKPVWIADSDK